MVLIVIGAVHITLSGQPNNILGITLTVLGISILAITALVVPFALGIINWRLRSGIQRLPPPEVVENKNNEGVE